MTYSQNTLFPLSLSGLLFLCHQSHPGHTLPLKHSAVRSSKILSWKVIREWYKILWWEKKMSSNSSTANSAHAEQWEVPEGVLIAITALSEWAQGLGRSLRGSLRAWTGKLFTAQVCLFSVTLTFTKFTAQVCLYSVTLTFTKFTAQVCLFSVTLKHWAQRKHINEAYYQMLYNTKVSSRRQILSISILLLYWSPQFIINKHKDTHLADAFIAQIWFKHVTQSSVIKRQHLLLQI